MTNCSKELNWQQYVMWIVLIWQHYDLNCSNDCKSLMPICHVFLNYTEKLLNHSC